MRRTQPLQPLVWDAGGADHPPVLRFQENAVVRFLYDWAANHGMTLNDLALIPFPAGDREQFYQLIGYSVSGFGDLDFVRLRTLARVDRATLPRPPKRKP